MRPMALSSGARGPSWTSSPGVRLTAAGWLVGLAVTALILWSPYVSSGVRSRSLHLMLDTADACIALLVAYLVHARSARRHHWQDRFLAQGLVLLAVGNIALAAAAERLPGARPGTLDVWLPLAIRVMGVVCILLAALADHRPVRQASAQRRLWLLPLAILVLTCSILWSVRSRLPVAFDTDAVQNSAEHPLLTAHPVLIAAQAFTALCFLVASSLFAFQSAQRDDELLRWLGPAFALAGFARVNYLLFPSLYTDWLYTGDLLRTGSYLLLLVGAGRELRQYWTAQAGAAVLEDRRRLARELHDGVIQELAYARMVSHVLPGDLPARGQLLAACDRGLDEARAAVQALGRPADEPLGFVLHRAARELAERYQVDLDVEVDDSIIVSDDQQHALMRITREAVANAARHGKAKAVRVTLDRVGDRRRLVVEDDGQGFDVQCVATENIGYGLVSMRDRTRDLPGTFDVESRHGSGTLVTVTW